MTCLNVAGIDPGRKYLAWAVVQGSPGCAFRLHRHGIVYPPNIGDTKNFGTSLSYWHTFVRHFIESDLKPAVVGIERFTYRPKTGASSEEINLHIPGIISINTHLVRNTEWKRWFKKYVDPEGTDSHYRLSTPHEADAVGIARYTAEVLLPTQRMQDKGAS